MDCREARRALSAMADGELPADRVGTLEEHLTGCAECARAARVVEAVKAHFAALPRLAAPEGLVQAVRRRIAAPAGRVLFGERSFRVAAAAAAVLLFLSTAALFAVPRRAPAETGAITADAALDQIMDWIVRDHAPAAPAEDGDR